jgi:uncharacterized membrane protein YbhN (UPF0104 family)
VNALVPMRGGDMVRVAAARRVIPESTTPTIVATLVAETAFGLVMIVALAIAAGAAGWLPVLSLLPSVNGLGLSALLRNPLVAGIGVLVALAAVTALAIAGRRRAVGFARELARGMRVLGSARSFARLVALPQTFDWALRGATAYALLLAFGMHASVRAAVIVLVVDSIASSLPFTPAGVGAQQALLALALGGSSQVLAFSVGAQATFTVVNVMLGLAASLAIFGHVHVRRLVRAAVPAG